MDLARPRRPVRSLGLAICAALSLALALPLNASDAGARVVAADATVILPAPVPEAEPEQTEVQLVYLAGVEEEIAVEDAETHTAADAAKGERHAVKPKPKPKPKPAPRSRPVFVAGDTVWDRLARCESGGNWAHSSGQYHGGLQFHPDTWRRHKLSGYPEYAYQATREQQIEVGKRVQASQGWAAWPHCSRVLGLR